MDTEIIRRDCSYIHADIRLLNNSIRSLELDHPKMCNDQEIIQMKEQLLTLQQYVATIHSSLY